MRCNTDCFNCTRRDCTADMHQVRIQPWEVEYLECAGLRSENLKARKGKIPPDYESACRLHTERKNRKLTLEQLGKIVGRAESTIRDWESGRTWFDEKIFNGILWEVK